MAEAAKCPSEKSCGFRNWLALFGMTATFGPSIGPTIGGWLTDNYGWQWIFFINVVPGLIMLAIIWFCLEEDPMDLSLLKGLDYFGIIAMAIGLGSLEYVLEEGERKDWFGNPVIVRFACIAGIFITLFLVRELADLLIISTLAIGGIAMAPLPVSVIAGEFAAAVVFGLILDGVKIPVFARLGIT
jgi:MFS family permease